MDHGNPMGPAPIHRGNIIEYANDAFRELVGVDVPVERLQCLLAAAGSSDRVLLVEPHLVDIEQFPFVVDKQHRRVLARH